MYKSISYAGDVAPVSAGDAPIIISGNWGASGEYLADDKALYDIAYQYESGETHYDDALYLFPAMHLLQLLRR